MFVVGLAGTALTQEEQAILKGFPVGGFVLFKNNCTSPEQIRALCGSLWKTATELPPFIAIDHEGGEAHRLPKPFTHFPYAERIAATGDPGLAYQAGRASAAELALAGINVNFAPVLDVNSNPRNPVIGKRSFGSDPTRVVTFSQQWIQGTRDAGIIPCGKHFPRHGDTAKDSHVDLPCVDRNLPGLRAIELPPFIEACRSQIDSLMTAHVVYRALDREFPATLSSKIITSLLREELGYDGVVFSDALEMKAISDNYGDKEAGTLAVRAGADVLLCCQIVSKVLPMFESLCNAADKNPAIRERIEMSYRRISLLKRRRLSRFNGLEEKEISKVLAGWNHQKIVDQIIVEGGERHP